MHGIIFFYIQKFAEGLAKASWSASPRRTTVSSPPKTFLPTKSYPDEDAVSLLSSAAESAGQPLSSLLETFGAFLGPHLVKVAGQHVDPAWRTLDLVEHTETVIHTMVRATTPEATPPVIRESLERLARSKWWAHRTTAVSLLPKLGEGAKPSIPLLKRTAERDPHRKVRGAAQSALKKLKKNEANK